MYKHGNHLTPGLSKVKVLRCGFPLLSLAGFFGAGGLARIHASKTS